MQVVVHDSSTVSKEITVVIPKESFQQEFDRQLVKIAKKKLLPGFRKGKVPLSYFRQHFAHEIHEQTAAQLVLVTVPLALKEAQISPIAKPLVKSISTDDNLKYVVEVEVLPVINTINFSFPEDQVVERVALFDDDIAYLIEKCRNTLGQELDDKTLLDNLGIDDASDVQDRLANLRTELRNVFEHTAASLNQNSLKEQVFTMLLEQNPFQIPKQLVIERMNYIHQQSCSAKKTHSHGEEYLQSVRAVAERAVALTLLLRAAVSQYNLVISEQQMHDKLNDLSLIAPNPEKFVAQKKQDPKFMNKLEIQLLEEAVLARVLQGVTLQEKTISYQEFLRRKDHT